SIAPEARLLEFERAREAVRALFDAAEAALSLVTPFTNGFTPPLKISGKQVGAQNRLLQRQDRRES
ncbi:MAG: hypothetical protein ACREEP_15020, partial [Dongiaceae bacterium]